MSGAAPRALTRDRAPARRPALRRLREPGGAGAARAARRRERGRQLRHPPRLRGARSVPRRCRRARGLRREPRLPGDALRSRDGRPSGARRRARGAGAPARRRVPRRQRHAAVARALPRNGLDRRDDAARAALARDRALAPGRHLVRAAVLARRLVGAAAPRAHARRARRAGLHDRVHRQHRRHARRDDPRLRGLRVDDRVPDPARAHARRQRARARRERGGSLRPARARERDAPHGAAGSRSCRRRPCVSETWSWWRRDRRCPPTAACCAARASSTSRCSPANRSRCCAAPGDAVTGGTRNTLAEIDVRVTATAAGGTLARIAALLERAQAERPPVQRLADRVAGVFAPAVLLAAGATALVWTWRGAPALDVALIAASVLIVACPCALGLATPVAITAAIGRAAGFGVLFKSGAAVEALRARRGGAARQDRDADRGQAPRRRAAAARERRGGGARAARRGGRRRGRVDAPDRRGDPRGGGASGRRRGGSHTAERRSRSGRDRGSGGRPGPAIWVGSRRLLEAHGFRVDRVLEEAARKAAERGAEPRLRRAARRRAGGDARCDQLRRSAARRRRGGRRALAGARSRGRAAERRSRGGRRLRRGAGGDLGLAGGRVPRRQAGRRAVAPRGAAAARRRAGC